VPADRTVYDFSYLCSRLSKFVQSVLAQEGGAPDPDDIVELRHKSPDEAVWRIIPLDVVLKPSPELPPGEYWATLYEVDPKNPEQKTPIREIVAELRPPRSEESNQNAVAYVRACGLAFEHLRSAAQHSSGEVERLTSRLREADDDRDRMREEIRKRDELILALERELSERDDPGVFELLQQVYAVVKAETATPPASPPADPQKQIPATTPEAP
jgi:hypothetical protein